MLASLAPGLIGSLFGVLLISPIRRRRFNQRMGGRGQVRRYRRALRLGRVPPDADTGRWRAHLDEALSPKGRKQRRRFEAFMGGLVVVAIVLGVLTRIAAPEDPVLEIWWPTVTLLVVWALMHADQVRLHRRQVRLRELLSSG